jgi:hypothetical protein
MIPFALALIRVVASILSSGRDQTPPRANETLQSDSDDQSHAEKEGPQQAEQEGNDDDSAALLLSTNEVEFDLTQPSPSADNNSNITLMAAQSAVETLTTNPALLDIEALSTVASPSSSSTGSTMKRRHWELSPPKGPLQNLQPSDLTSKRIALGSSASSSSTSSTSLGLRASPVVILSRTAPGLMRARTYEPDMSRSSSYVTLGSFGGAAASASGDTSLFSSTVPLSLQEEGSNHGAPSGWTRMNWKSLEKVYLEMNGDAQSDVGLGMIADRFLAEEAARTSQDSTWDR